MEIAVPDYHDNFIAHAYLAVDFFFCLSGFVIAYAYDSKLSTIGVLQFFKLRLIRLHPLVVLGTVIGLFAFIFDPFSDLESVYGMGKTILMFITGCLLIPYPVVPERYLNLFHLNPPTWSLFWEYVANIVYALLLYKLRNKLLWVLTIIAAIFVCYEARVSTNLSVGWSGENISGGAIRVAYSFLAGMLVYRTQFIIKSKMGFGLLSILLLIAFLFPFSAKVNWLTEPLIVLFYFPFVVAIGAGVRLSSKLTKLCRFSGEISYPLYMVHYPFIWIFFSYVIKYKPTTSTLAIVIPISVLLLVAFAYLVMKYIDVPVRKYFKNKLQTKASLAAVEKSQAL